jgi:hypothetical protein
VHFSGLLAKMVEETMAVTPRKKVAVRASSRARSSQSYRAPVDAAIPAKALPTAREMDELGRFADRVAEGKERLKYMKI